MASTSTLHFLFFSFVFTPLTDQLLRKIGCHGVEGGTDKRYQVTQPPRMSGRTNFISFVNEHGNKADAIYAFLLSNARRSQPALVEAEQRQDDIPAMFTRRFLGGTWHESSDVWG